MKLLLATATLLLSLSILSAQNIIDDNSSLKNYKLFGAIEVGIPQSVPRNENNMSTTEEMGFAYFQTKDEKVEIKMRKQSEGELSMIKEINDGLATSMYKGTILRSEIIELNGLKFFVTDIKGYWNGGTELIGMFRYYFNANGASYNLLMRYPVDLVDKTKELKEKMIKSIKVVQ